MGGYGGSGFLGILSGIMGNIVREKAQRHAQEQQNQLYQAALLSQAADTGDPRARTLLTELTGKQGKEGKELSDKIQQYFQTRDLVQQRQMPPITNGQLAQLAGMGGTTGPGQFGSMAPQRTPATAAAPQGNLTLAPSAGAATPGYQPPPAAAAAAPPAAPMTAPMAQQPRPRGLLGSLAGGLGTAGRSIVEGLTGVPIGGGPAPMSPVLEQQGKEALARQQSQMVQRLGGTSEQGVEYALTGKIATPRSAIDRLTPQIFTDPEGKTHRGSYDPQSGLYLDENRQPAPSEWIPGREGAAGSQDLFKGNTSQRLEAANKVLAADPGTYPQYIVDTANQIKEQSLELGRGRWREYFQMALNNVGLDGNPWKPGGKVTPEEASIYASQMLAQREGIQIDLQRQRLWEQEVVAGRAPTVAPAPGPASTPASQAAPSGAPATTGAPTTPAKTAAKPAPLTADEKTRITTWANAGGKITGSLPRQAGEQTAVNRLSEVTGRDPATLATDAQELAANRTALNTQIQRYGAINNVTNTIDQFGNLFEEKASKIQQTRSQLLNVPWQSIKLETVGDPDLRQYLLALQGFQRQYGILAIGGAQSRSQLPVRVVDLTDKLMSPGMNLRDAIATVQQIRREAVAEREGFYNTQRDIRQRILENPISQAVGANLPAALPGLGKGTSPPGTPTAPAGGTKPSSAGDLLKRYPPPQ